MIRDEMINRLLALDEEASLLLPQAERLHLVIVGGGALILMEYVSRATHDIDVLSASDKLKTIMEDYDINARVQTYINNFPYNYEDRLQKLDIPGRMIDFYTASLEDIVIAKLYSFRPSDKADIEDPNVVKHINWEVLHHLATDENEAKAAALNNHAYNLFLADYYDYEGKFRPCDN